MAFPSSSSSSHGVPASPPQPRRTAPGRGTSDDPASAGTPGQQVPTVPASTPPATHRTLDSLPPELLARVAAQLDTRDYTCLANTSQRFLATLDEPVGVAALAQRFQTAAGRLADALQHAEPGSRPERVAEAAQLLCDNIPGFGLRNPDAGLRQAVSDLLFLVQHRSVPPQPVAAPARAAQLQVVQALQSLQRCVQANTPESPSQLARAVRLRALDVANAIACGCAPAERSAWGATLDASLR